MLFLSLLFPATGSMQETNQLRFQLQQAQSAHLISNNMNKALQVNFIKFYCFDFRGVGIIAKRLVVETLPVCWGNKHVSFH